MRKAPTKALLMVVSWSAMARSTPSGSPDSKLRPRRNFSVRLPDELYVPLEALSEQSGESMNKLIGAAVARLVERPDLDPSATGPDINPTIARDALKQGPDAIGPLKGIAKHASNRNQMALASVLWAAAARIVATSQGPEAAAVELCHSADVAERSGHVELAIALWEEALELDANNLEAANRLGQRLHHLAQKQNDAVDQYRRAERYLARVTFVDNRAKLFHGWSAFHIARADGDRDGEERALGEIEEALKQWAFSERSGVERTSWLRQIERLRAAGFQSRADSLVDFANRNARWEALDPTATSESA
jgi:tetratricopeptide (TPR) repeat protein